MPDSGVHLPLPGMWRRQAVGRRDAAPQRTSWRSPRSRIGWSAGVRHSRIQDRPRASESCVWKSGGIVPCGEGSRCLWSSLEQCWGRNLKAWMGSCRLYWIAWLVDGRLRSFEYNLYMVILRCTTAHMSALRSFSILRLFVVCARTTNTDLDSTPPAVVATEPRLLMSPPLPEWINLQGLGNLEQAMLRAWFR